MSELQQKAVDLVKSGESIAIVGKGGTGKSTTVESMIDDYTVIVCPTAAAALRVGGETVHSTFSLGHGMQTEKDLNRITPEMKQLFGKQSEVKLLVFDEAYNLRADLLDAVDHKLKTIKGNTKPFGGLQVVFSGDCLQIEPIVAANEARVFSRKYKSPFIFDSKVYKELNPQIIHLTKSYRNENKEQQEALSAIRLKDCSVMDGKPKWMWGIDKINEIAKHGGYEPENDMFLASYNKDVDKINQTQYDKINSPEFTYRANKEGVFNVKKSKFPESLKLKVGTKVLFNTNNRNAGYYNGLMGEVSFLSNESIIVSTEEGDIVAELAEDVNEKISVFKGKVTKTKVGSMSQYPIQLAYATSINKSQGATLDNLTLDLGKTAFANGMLYVALSRLRDLKNLTLVRPIEYNDLKVSQKALNYLKEAL